jgi:XRE family aerobic/anaerobic benzoate catabolism transcriptional regulator
VREQLLQQFGDSPAQRHQRIALIGLRGAGKSTLGTRLAKELTVAFVELDHEIEREAGTSLSEIFLLYGQAGYRRYERRALEKVLERDQRCVIATGAASSGLPEPLRRPAHRVAAGERTHGARGRAGRRPGLAGNAMDDLRRILAAGSFTSADTVVDTAGRSVEQSLKDLRRALRG